MYTRMLQNSRETGAINIDCVDPLGRTALLMAIDNENLEMVELLLENKVETKDALLHAINEEYVEAVEVLLDHEESIHVAGEPWSWEAIPADTATFTPDITPLILAAHTDNYEVIKILLDRGAVLPTPHDIRCGCDDCTESRSEDSLRHSRRRINAYRALASPSLIALSSKDPILTAFELSWELRRLAFSEHEFKSEYLALRKQVQNFATALLDHTRSSCELEILLNHDPAGPAYQHGERMHLNRLKLAIKYRQKKFVAHPNVQQLLASIWYEGLPGFRQMNMILQGLEVCRIGLLFPFYSLSYIICPWVSVSQVMRKPFIKFICNSASYFFFLFLLILASQRIEDIIGWDYNDNSNSTKRGAKPSLVESCILAWVAGLIWSEIKQLWDVGLKEYINDMWNVVDFITNSLYVATIGLRTVAYFDVEREKELGINTVSLPREDWDTWDPTLISEGLFAAANIFSSLKLVYIFSVNPYLGPLQVSLSRMVIDIMKFTFLYLLVLFAFSCGMNQLLWYYADLEKQACMDDMRANNGTVNMQPIGGRKSSKMAYERDDKIIIEINHCLAYRKFANLWETSQTLFWAAFGLIDLDNFELTGIKEFTRFWGLIMFGSFSLINIIVLLNLLIAMMNHSYQLISVSSEKADTEWKFARSKLWISYFEEGGTVPPPFNIIPTPKSVYYILKWIYLRLCGSSTRMKKEHLKTRKVRQASERDLKYQAIMRNLVRRYVTQEQRKAENEGVTEDDVNEIKNDISAFRFELIEIMRASGMNTGSATGPSGPGGKKNRQKERRLMKGFHLSTGASTAAPLPDNVNPMRFKGGILQPPSDVAIDMAGQKKTQTRGFARIAKLVTSNNQTANKKKEVEQKDESCPDKGDLEQKRGSIFEASDIGRGWKRLNLADAIKTVKVPKVIRPAARNPSEESQVSIVRNTTTQSSLDDQGGTISDSTGAGSSTSRSSSKRDKYTRNRNPVSPMGPNRQDIAGPGAFLDSGIASIEESSSTRSLVTDTSMRCNGKLQRTSRIDEMDCTSLTATESENSACVTKVLQTIPSCSPPDSGKLPPDMLNTPIPDLWGKFPTPSPPHMEEEEPLVPSTPMDHSKAGLPSTVPGLQPANNNRRGYLSQYWSN